jgi:hypothetical protein
MRYTFNESRVSFEGKPNPFPLRQTKSRENGEKHNIFSLIFGFKIYNIFVKKLSFLPTSLPFALDKQGPPVNF